MRVTSLRTLAFIVPLVAAACTGGGSATAPSATAASAAAKASAATATAAASPTAEPAMPLPPSAAKMKVSIVSPTNGTKVTDNALTLQVKIDGFEPTCDLAGKPLKDGTGHFHVLLDKALIDMFCVTAPKISFQNVKPGTHTITVVPALNDHAEVEDNVQSVSVDFAPTKPLAEITAASSAAKPTVKITGPSAGATVSGKFDVSVDLSNFNLSCDLEGKPNVAGYGHWHLNVDSDTGPMMGMMTMLGMTCDKTFHASTEGLTPGKHTLIAVLVDNMHAPINVSDRIDVVVK